MRLALVLLALILGFSGCGPEKGKVDSASSPPATSALATAPTTVPLNLHPLSSHPGLASSTAGSQAAPQANRTTRVSGYSFELEADEFLHLEIVQSGTDLVAEVWEAGGALLLRVDTPTGEHSTETLFLAPPRRTALVLRVDPLAPTRSPAPFEIRVRARRPATMQDRQKASALGKITAADLMWKNDPGAAESLYLEAIHLLDQAEEPLIAAISAVYLSHFYLEKTDTWPLAEQILRRAVSFSERAGDRPHLATALHELGLVLLKQSDFQNGREALERSLTLWRELSVPHEVGILLNDLALLNQSAGQVHLALEAYSESLELWQSLSERRFEAITRTNLGTLYSSFGSERQANLHYRQALNLLGTSPSPNRALALTRLADNLLYLDGPEAALPLMREALDIQRALGDQAGEAFVLNSIGRVQKRAQQPRMALEALRRSLALYREKELWKEASSASQNLASALEDLGHFKRAEEEFHQSLRWALQHHNIDNIISGLHGLARVERALGREQEALAHLAEAISLIERQRQGPAHFDHRSSLLEPRLGLYELMIELLVAGSEKGSNPEYLERAFEVTEMSRARGFLDALRRAPRIPEGGSEILREIDRLRVEINDLHLRRFEARANTKESITPYDEALAVALGRYQRLEAHLFELRSDNARIPSLKEVRQYLLAPGTLLLSYHLGKERSFVWSVSRDEVHLHVLPPRQKLDARVGDLVRRLRRPANPVEADALKLALVDTGRALLGPVAAEVATAERLLILPGGSLKSLPFGALPDPDFPDRLLAASKEVVYLPSISVLVELRRQQGLQQLGKGLAILADPVVNAEDPRWNGSPPGGPRSPYTRLEHAGSELERIQAAAKGMPFLAAAGFAANRDLWLSGRLASYRYLHFATHGFWDESWPELSQLLLSTYARDGSPRDGFLRAYEIRRLRLSAELVTLSACDSGASREIGSEGMFGLSRGFFDAGARNVLMSLWPVHDAATAELMASFYHHLWVEKQSPARALQLAQKQMADGTSWPDPFYWAGFVLYGDFGREAGSATLPTKF